MLYRSQNLLLQMVVVVCVGVIGGMIYHNYSQIQETQKTLQRDISDQTGDIRSMAKSVRSIPKSVRSIPKSITWI